MAGRSVLPPARVGGGAAPPSVRQPRTAAAAKTRAAPSAPAKGAWGTRGKVVDTSSSQIAQLTLMGFGDEAARSALRQHAWNVNQALDWLLVNGTTAFQKNVVEAESAPEEDKSWSRRSTDYDCSASINSQNVDDSVTSIDAQSEAVDFAQDEVAAESTAAVDVEQPSSLVQERRENPEPVAPAAESTAEETVCAAATDVVEAPSCKELMRANQTWAGDEASNVLGVAPGTFVQTWPQSKTDQGWIYAELERDAACGGWLPVSVLQNAPAGCRWMRAICSWSDEQNVDVVAGSMLLVYADSRTELGWVYVITSETRGCDADASDAAKGARAGWAPDYTVAWIQS